MAQPSVQETIEDAQIIFRNFSGRGGMYNREGDRNFCILLDPERATQLAEEGWNIKTTKERELDDQTVGGEPYLQVTVGYKGRPPRIVTITSNGRTDLGEGEVEVLDHLDLAQVDVIFRNHDWEVNGKTGRKAYLKTLFARINEDELEMKYSNVPISRKSAPHGEDILQDDLT